MTDTKEEVQKFDIRKIFVISEEKSDEIIKAFQHAKIDSSRWQEVLKEVLLKVKCDTKEEAMYLGYVYGIMYKEAEDPFRRLANILKKD